MAELDWLKQEIGMGLRKLQCLGLERTPAAEMIALTASVWLESLTANRVWDMTPDAPRFRAAFSTLCASRKSWPVPQDLIDAMPPREQLALTKQPIKANPERAAQAAAELEGFLRRAH